VAVGVALVFPAFIMTRVAWAAGFAAGQRDTGRPAD
jgi:hypothetical protein